MLPKLDKKSLQSYYNHEEIIKDTALQVKKDFASYGYDVELPEDIRWMYEDLFVQLVPKLGDLLSNHNRQLLAMLYTIDVSELKIRKEASSRPDVPLAEIITEMVLERELKKVITRHYFREQGIK